MAAFRLIYFVASVLFTVILAVVTRTIIYSFRPLASDPCTPSDLDFIHADDKIIGRFSKAISFETVSLGVGNYNRSELLKLQQFIFREFADLFDHPLVESKVIGNYSLLVSIKGTEPTLKPYLIASHFDVVPATNESWDVPPFEGRVQHGFIWGRGTLDVKNGVMGSLEALRFLLNLGHKPRRSFFLAFGHDEEVSGIDGAKQIAENLKSQGVQLEFLIDEGTAIIKDAIPGINIPYAVIGVVEKGFLTLELSVHTSGGHSSMPPKETSIGILANAMSRLEACQMPVVFESTGPIREMFENFAPQVPWYLRVVLANLWLFSPVLTRILERKPSTNALLRTTTAVTQFNAGIKENVIAPTAIATVNHRVHPRNTLEEVIEHDKRCINDERVQIRVMRSRIPSSFSRWDRQALGFQVLSKSIRQVFPDVGVSPGLMIANTDTWHYRELTDAVYRFMPSILTPEDLKRIHGFNERIGVKNYQQIINYFYHLMRNSDDVSIDVENQHGEL